MRPLFQYFGSKWRLAEVIGYPLRDVVVECCGGGAGFASRYAEVLDKVFIIERDPMLITLWRFLKGANYDDIMSIPLIKSLDEMPDCPERLLPAMWFGKGDTKPRKKMSPANLKDLNSGRSVSLWSATIRQRTANNIHKINNWEIIEGDFENSPDGDFHFHFDPPYQHQGSSYTFGSRQFDYDRARRFIHSLQDKGRVGEVCEGEGADWLEFQPLIDLKTQSNAYKTEYIYRLSMEGRLL